MSASRPFDFESLVREVALKLMRDGLSPGTGQGRHVGAKMLDQRIPAEQKGRLWLDFLAQRLDLATREERYQEALMHDSGTASTRSRPLTSGRTARTGLSAPSRLLRLPLLPAGVPAAGACRRGACCQVQHVRPADLGLRPLPA